MTISLGAPTVMQLRATQFGGEEQDEFTWRINVASSTFGTHNLRPINGRLRADGPSGWGEIDVSGVLIGTEGIVEDELIAQLTESITAETLFDFARSHLQPLLSQVGSDVRIPVDSPQSTVIVTPRDPSNAPAPATAAG